MLKIFTLHCLQFNQIQLFYHFKIILYIFLTAIKATQTHGADNRIFRQNRYHYLRIIFYPPTYLNSQILIFRKVDFNFNGQTPI